MLLDCGDRLHCQSTNDIQREQFFDLLVGHEVLPNKGRKRSCNRNMAERIRVLMVPKGSCNCAAISIWVSPRKKANSKASRCSEGRLSSAARTMPARSPILVAS